MTDVKAEQDDDDDDTGVVLDGGRLLQAEAKALFQAAQELNAGNAKKNERKNHHGHRPHPRRRREPPRSCAHVSDNDVGYGYEHNFLKTATTMVPDTLMRARQPSTVTQSTNSTILFHRHNSRQRHHGGSRAHEDGLQALLAHVLNSGSPLLHGTMRRGPDERCSVRLFLQDEVRAV